MNEVYNFYMFSKEGNRKVQSAINQFMTYSFKVKDLNMMGQVLAQLINTKCGEKHSEWSDTTSREAIFEYLEKHLESYLVEAIFNSYW